MLSLKILSSALLVSILSFISLQSANADEGASTATAPVTATSSNYIVPNIEHANFGMIKIVVPVSTNDKAVQGMKLRNIGNAITAVSEWKGKTRVTVVLYAKGVSLLQNPDLATRTQIDNLKSKGVKFDVCNNSLKEQGINYHTLYRVNDDDIVPSGFAEVAYLQARKGYSVDPMN